MRYFTSDWHLGEDRIGINGKPNLFYRPFDSIFEQNVSIITPFLRTFKDGDELWHLGDVLVSKSGNAIEMLDSLRSNYPNSTFNLIVGNYDEDKLDILSKYFHNIHEDFYVRFDDVVKGVYLNHYPAKCRRELDKTHQPWEFAITGHIHGLWKVQKGIINVGVDAWHFKPVSEDEIKFCWNAMQNFYDENVFPYGV